MLYSKIILDVKRDEAVSSDKVILYRGDRNVDIEFTIRSDYYTLSECSYAQLIFARPLAQSVFSEITKMDGNRVTLRITENMIDELNEKGPYVIQVRLFDSNHVAKVTLPPCYDVLYIREPISIDSDSGIINVSTVNSGTASTNNSGLGPTFSDGKYNKTNWRDGDLITDKKLNKIEDAIEHINDENIAQYTLLEEHNHDGRYLREHQDISHLASKEELPSLDGYATETYVNTAMVVHNHDGRYLTEHQDISHLATKEEIPSIDGLADERYVDELIQTHNHDGRYLTEHQDISHLATKEDIKSIEGYATEVYVDQRIYSHNHDDRYIREHQDISHLATTEDLRIKFDDVIVNQEETTDSYTVLDFYAEGSKVKTVGFTGGTGGGGGGGTASPYISTESDSSLFLGVNEDLQLDINFISPNPGRGSLYIAINNVDAYTTNISEGDNTVQIPERIFKKGVNYMTIYARDRVGIISNTLQFEVRYGSLEIKTDFDSQSSYDVGSPIRFYFTPSAADTSMELTFYMSIDGETQDGVSCVSDTRSYFTFQNTLGVGCHKCEAYIKDSRDNISNILYFNLILIDDSSIVVASEVESVSAEEGVQLSLDFKVYMKNNISFITKIYVDEILTDTGSCGLEKAYYKTNSLSEGSHVIRLEVYNQTETVSDSITWNVTITESTYKMLEPVTAGALFLATAYNKTNADGGKETWIGVDQNGEHIEAKLTNFAFNNESGWVDDSLIISGNSYVEIPVAPLADNAKYGFTLDIQFLSKHIGVDNAEVLTLWDDEKNCGIKITTENVILKSTSKDKECNLYFSDSEYTSVMFVIDRNELKAKIYLNGVMCDAFHLSDYVANGISYLEDFAVNSNIMLGGGNTNGRCEIKNIRVYEVALTTEEILRNFMANERDKKAQQALVEFQKGNELPTLTVYCDFSGLGKDDKKPCKIVYNSTDEVKYGKSFILDHKESQLQYQGTSSMAYPIKNYRLNLKDEAGDKWYYDFPNGKPECRFTLKADFMSSGHWQNTGFTKWVNDNLYHYDVKDEKSMNPKKWYDINNGGKLTDTRECIYGFPCRLILVNDGTTTLNVGQNEPTPGNTKDMGIFNFNHDKDCADTIGLDQKVFPNCASFEIAANSDTSAGAFMSYDTVNPEGISELEYIQQSFELRFPDADDVPEGWGFLGVGEEGTGLKALIDWVDHSTDEEFVNDFEEHFHKDYTLRYFLMVMVCGMVDNLGKNLMLDTWDNKVYMPRFYDCDTICSYDNSGDIKFDVDIEMEQGYWNTSSSRLWTRVRDLMHDDLVDTYNDMRQNGLSYESLMRYFYDEQIAKIPQRYYNMDFDVKYAPFADSYMGMAHGDGYEHLKRWLKKRLTFCDTLYDYAPGYNNDVLTIRANTTDEMTIYIETYTPLYQHLSWYNGQMDKKKIDGVTPVAFSGRAMAATDQEVLIYGGSNIKRITGIKSMNPNQMLIGYATRLAEIDASDCLILADVNSDGANLSPHIYLNNVDLSNCPALSGTLRVNNSQLLQSLDISGTMIDSLQLPTSVRNLETLKLSETVSDIVLRDAVLLSELQIPIDIEYLSLINVPNLKKITTNASKFDKLNTLIIENPTINPVSSITSKADNLEYVRLTNMDIRCLASDFQTLIGLKGVDSLGNEISLSQAVTGKVTLVDCPTETEPILRAEFPLVEFTIANYVKSYNVKFYDGDGNLVYSVFVPEMGEAIYNGPTPTKTETMEYTYRWTGWDRNLKPIVSNMDVTATFEAITKYYTIRFFNGITHDLMAEYSLAYGSSITKPTPPEGHNRWEPSDATVTGDIDFYSGYVMYPDDLSIFAFTSISSGYAVSLKTSTPMPSHVIFPFEYNGIPVTAITGNSSYSATYQSNIKSCYIPDTIKYIGGYAFRYFNIEKLVLPPTVMYWHEKNPRSTFANNPVLVEFEAPGLTSMPAALYSSSGMFANCTSLEKVTIGSPERPFTTWNEYSTSSSSTHLYNTSALRYVNLVTENGLESDVTFKNKPAIASSTFIYSAGPVTEFTDENGNTYRGLGNHAELTGYVGNETNVVIPTMVNGMPVKVLGDSVFENNTTIESCIGESIEVIKDSCFNACGALVSVDFPVATKIGNYSFNNNAMLKSVNIPMALEIGTYGFADSVALTQIDLPKVTTLGSYAFYSTGLVSIAFPEVVSVGSNCFQNCRKLMTVNLPKATSIDAYAFYYTLELEDIHAPLVDTLGSSAFYQCSSLTNISFPNVTMIPASCFGSCTQITSFSSDKVTNVGQEAFAYCSKLETIDLPNATTIGSEAFTYDLGLVNVTFPKVTSLGTNAFSRCSYLKTFEAPIATSIAAYCFDNCTRLETVNITMAKTLGSYCLRGCTALAQPLVFPQIQTINSQILANSTLVTEITFGGVGYPIANTGTFMTNVFTGSSITKIIIYVNDPANPPELAGSPWGATDATVVYEQA